MLKLFWHQGVSPQRMYPSLKLTRLTRRTWNMSENVPMYDFLFCSLGFLTRAVLLRCLMDADFFIPRNGSKRVLRIIISSGSDKKLVGEVVSAKSYTMYHLLAEAFPSPQKMEGDSHCVNKPFWKFWSSEKVLISRCRCGRFCLNINRPQ